MRPRKYMSVYQSLSISGLVLLICAAAAAQITTTQPPNPNITAPGSQRHEPQGGQRPPGRPSIANAPPPNRALTVYPGDVEGFVYWDANAITHKPAGTCAGLAVSVSAAGSSNITIQPGNHFKYAGQVKTFLSGGTIQVFDVCIYAYDHQPVGPQLQAQLVVTDRNAFSQGVMAQTGTVAPITIINAQCNMLPPIVPSSVSDLTAHWGSCQNRAYDVNFALAPAFHIMSSSGGTGMSSGSGSVRVEKTQGPAGTPMLRNAGPAGTPMLSGAPPQGMLANGAGSMSQSTGGLQQNPTQGQTAVADGKRQAHTGTTRDAAPQALTDTNMSSMQNAGLAGNVEGHIFWDASVIQYKLSTPCQGLQVSVVDMANNQTLASSSNLSAVWSTPQMNMTGGTQGPWMVCGYSFHQLPAKETLEVHAAITQPATFALPVVVKQAPGSFGTDFVLGTGGCNQTPQQTLSAILGSFALICGGNAFNVNLEVFAFAAPARGAIPPSSIKVRQSAQTGQQPSSGILLSQASPGSTPNSTLQSLNTPRGSLTPLQPGPQSPGSSVLMDAQVPPSLGQLHSSLCSIAKCTYELPVVKSLDTASVVSPGGKVVVEGANFNSSDGNSGQIVLKIGTKFPMTIVQLGQQPKPVYHQPYVERQLTVLGWADTHVFGQIPPDISGAMDGPATLEVWRSDGSKSVPFTVHFTAARDFQTLPMSDVTLTSCDKTADGNRCDQSSDSSQLAIPSLFPGFGAAFSIFGEHTMFIQNQTQEQATGYDSYSFDLKNGWTLDESFQNGIGEKQPCKGDFADEHFSNSKPSSKPTTSNVQIPWEVGCDLQYAIALHITGPKGVPWK